MNTSLALRRGALLASAFFANLLPAATVADWTFDAFPAGQKITAVTSNSITLSAVASLEPTASSLTPSNPGFAHATSASISGGKILGSSGVVSALNFGAGQAFTIEGWFNINAFTATAQSIFSNRGASTAGGYTISAGTSSAPTLTFQIRDAGGTLRNYSASTSLSAGTWYYFAATRNSAGNLGLSLYSTTGLLESVAASSFTVANAINSDSKTYLGRAGDAQGGLNFDGLIGELRISTGVLSGSQLLWTAIPEPASAACLAGVGTLLCATVARRRKN